MAGSGAEMFHDTLRDADILLQAQEDASDTPKPQDEDDVFAPQDATSETATTLRPDPPPSSRRRESEATDTVGGAESTDRPHKKRKRGVSPPWQFGTVEATTLKTADGRRISARFNPSAPVSESEGPSRARSTSQSMAKSRPPSPPWKKFEAVGPTSLSVDGVRKSGRMNKELNAGPKRTSPRQKKQTDKVVEVKKKADVRPASRGKIAQVDGAGDARPSSSSSARRRSLSPSSKKIAELRAKIHALAPTRSFDPEEEEAAKPDKRSHKRKRSITASPQSRRAASPVSNRKPHRASNAAPSPAVAGPPPKIKLRFGKQSLIPHPHPHAVPPSPPRPPQLNLSQLIEPFEFQERQLPYLELERGPPTAAEFKAKDQRLAVEEAGVRKRLVKAAQPGGLLTREDCSIYVQDEPDPQYGHFDHLAAHAEYFRLLQEREKDRHCALAKKVAIEAVERWKVLRGPTEEDLLAEEERIFKLIYRQVVIDVRGKWEMVSAHVDQLRKVRWEAEEDAKRQERLQKQLEKAEAMVARQRAGDEGSEVGEDEDEDEDGDDEDDGEENMSESDEDDADEGDESGELVGDALADYLKHRDAEPPDRQDQDTDDETGPTGMELDELSANATANATADTTETARESTANTALDLSINSFATPAASATTAEDRTVAASDGVANHHVDHAASHPDEAASPMPMSGDEDGDEPQEDTKDYMPIANDETDDGVVTGDAASAAPRRSRHSPSDDLDMAEAELKLSDDESEEMYDSDEDMDSSDEDGGDAASGEEGSDDEEEVAQTSTLGLLFANKEIKSALTLPTPSTSAGGDERDRTIEPVSDDNGDAQAGAQEHLIETHEDMIPAVHETAPTPPADHDMRSSPQPIDSVAQEPMLRSLSTEVQTMTGKQMVPIPQLLRGTLRSYQHAGLDWLASLKRNGINGILADEMGLGKTIQTIALLAHIAEQHDVWETHLVIVPTSVILNWVTEFNKFLPGFRVLGYYGTAEERAIKRKGWVNDPHHEEPGKRGYNVVIMSYNTALADISAIRNVSWHYMVLDEAHNIRNFQSQRFMSLIRLKTKARLLLTGTPLQNSLTELWSLLTFLTAGDDDPAHGDLELFLSNWKEPVKEIFDRGVSSLSAEAQKVVDQLHISLRPFLLRRLKSEVEKDLPQKTESVVVCKLSKRQRQLYQEYMGLASTRESLAKGNAITAGSVLLNLRKVCNHPDLFDPRPIQTSYAMELSPIEPFAVKESLVRKLLGEPIDLSSRLIIVSREMRKKNGLQRSKQLTAIHLLHRQVHTLEQKATPVPDLSNPSGCLMLQRLRQRERKLQQLRNCIRLTEDSLNDGPVYGADLVETLTIKTGQTYQFTARSRQPHQSSGHMRAWLALGRRPLQFEHLSDWHIAQDSRLQRDVACLDSYAERLHDTLTRFAFCTPTATAPVLGQAITPHSQQLLRASNAYPFDSDFAHEARSRTSIVFPDSRLLVYDSGKLQRLSKLLRELHAKGSRSLIFTQMTAQLNILEQFLNLLGLPYLRLDGSTPVERRMLYSSEFNRPDSKYQCMILSSRAGGVGLNLTGASSVIFYDLDWNPQMDRQCMDRAHRIGQVRNVEVYKMVSEKTVEENILRRATQKSLLDQAVIQEGHFTTEYEQPSRQADVEELDEDGNELSGAIDRFLGADDRTANQAIASVEDREDVQAAEAARKEENQDAEEFAERSSKGTSVARVFGPGVTLDGEDEGEARGHVDAYMVDLMETMLKDVPFVPPVIRRLDKDGRDPSHRKKKR
ncbi:swr1 complex component [Elasticomyces elasticus]|nr:swr1 complex component [Elasticomyces elasticus]KAK3635172.1 swr1 complex component [Elasticomyces elasticus]KAK4911519.1 swr1 complex component [Elasticomyces elasticus]KAK5751058.1 swr1 complex component [Elasticomyces elasticus]